MSLYFSMSLSRWPSQTKLPTFVDPTEKYLLSKRQEINRQPAGDTAMENMYLLGSGSADPDSLVCVNPHEVNPLDGSRLACATLTADVPLKVESSASSQGPDEISCGGFYQPQKKIKLEMEEFSDLSHFVLPKRTNANSADELNTPIFDKDAFDFTNYEKNVQADLHVQLRYDATSGVGGAQTSSAAARQPRQLHNNKDVFLQPDSTHHRNVTALPLDSRHYADAPAYSPAASENGTYSVSPTDAAMPLAYDMTNSVSVNLDCNNQYGLITPEGSEKSYNPDEDAKDRKTLFKARTTGTPKLSLDINLGNLFNTNILDVSTPNLIAEVVNLEATGFNILDLVNEDNLALTNDLFPNLYASDNQEAQPAAGFKKLAVKQPRKRRSKKYEDDDDEDYIPPGKKVYKRAEEYSDSESDDERARPRKKARGRPPKRTESFSSDCSVGRDGDVSKYRELRDKNNEASRKSRLKRKMKELEIEKENEELHNKNIKLKAQVEELEKMVNNFRDNLFKIMINK
ncbi:unnamed protein product [Phyllotreta striolata]|uniref:BZIP domain-containing protein n=1 Tax=Phyllotreta striolata TaxID=444603 RepID=A0A9N9XNH0_PHYSR|nr:unnamed protein product [Phyllotreta striolata]